MCLELRIRCPEHLVVRPGTRSKAALPTLCCVAQAQRRRGDYAPNNVIAEMKTRRHAGTLAAIEVDRLAAGGWITSAACASHLGEYPPKVAERAECSDRGHPSASTCPGESIEPDLSHPFARCTNG